jgi:hypothetical protein
MASRTIPNGFFGWTWSAVLAGMFASLVVQILLTMLGFGIGLLAIDIPTASSAPAATGWAAFIWWAVSGIIAAFVGGAVAAANSPDQTALGRIGHALAAWSVATVVVAAAMMPATAGSIAGNLVGPSYAATARVAYFANPAAPARETVGSTRPATQAQLEEARKHFAYAMLASFFALLLGAGAAYAAGTATTGQALREAARPVT